MIAKTSTRAQMIFRALLVDEHTDERVELFEGGVDPRRIEILYPYDLSFLADGLQAYMKAGKRITLRQEFATQQAIATEDTRLYRLLTQDQITATGNRVNQWWLEFSELEKAIVAHPQASFNKVTSNDRFSGSHDSQAGAFITQLLWAFVPRRAGI